MFLIKHLFAETILERFSYFLYFLSVATGCGSNFTIRWFPVETTHPIISWHAMCNNNRVGLCNIRLFNHISRGELWLEIRYRGWRFGNVEPVKHRRYLLDAETCHCCSKYGGLHCCALNMGVCCGDKNLCDAGWYAGMWCMCCDGC